ncbi:hypothetical protein BaRGS_00027522, partial [Batillaria attramentaria]
LTENETEDPAVKAAVRAVLAQGLSFRVAARLHGVSASRVYRAVSARTGRTSVPRKLNLTVKDEEELVRHGLRVARTEGRKRVKRSVERMAGSLARRNGVPFKNGLPCPLWWCKFKRRHPQLRDALEDQSESENFGIVSRRTAEDA